MVAFKIDNREYHVADTFGAWQNALNAEGGWLFRFGAYGTIRIVVLNEPGTSNLEDALETAAEALLLVAPGQIVTDEELHELYAEAGEEAGLTYRSGVFYDGDTELDWDTPRADSVRESAEADLTYTEAGWLTSYEWFVDDLHSGDEVYYRAVLAVLKDDPDEMADWVSEEDAMEEDGLAAAVEVLYGIATKGTGYAQAEKAVRRILGPILIPL